MLQLTRRKKCTSTFKIKIKRIIVRRFTIPKTSAALKNTLNHRSKRFSESTTPFPLTEVRAKRISIPARAQRQIYTRAFHGIITTTRPPASKRHHSCASTHLVQEGETDRKEKMEKQKRGRGGEAEGRARAGGFGVAGKAAFFLVARSLPLSVPLIPSLRARYVPVGPARRQSRTQNYPVVGAPVRPSRPRADNCAGPLAVECGGERCGEGIST